MKKRVGATAIAVIALYFTMSAYGEQSYDTLLFQQPVRAAADEVLLLTGEELAVSNQIAYQAVADPAHLPEPPNRFPSASNAEQGSVPVVGTDLVPNALQVRMPLVFVARRTYVLTQWESGKWGRRWLVNDARPAWISPARVFSSADRGGLGRYLKIIGRNLDPETDSHTRVRLSGPQIVVLDVRANAQTGSAANEFVAQVHLPDTLRPGEYAVELSRDGRSWQRVVDQSLRVEPDAVAPAVFAITSFKGPACTAETPDATPCLLRAVQAAARAGGGIVQIGAGTWHLRGNPELGANGIVLPPHVTIRGARDGATVLLLEPDWGTQHPAALFTLSGSNEISHLTIRDTRTWSPRDVFAPAIRLGIPGGPGVVSDVVITDNRFELTGTGIVDSMAPIADLVVARNVFAAYAIGLGLGGDRQRSFGIEDAIIVDNRFAPGSYLDTAARAGTMASELGAGRRVDFSRNSADGADTRYLQKSQDARGWRAAFFWHLNGNQEQVLIAENVATCTGDKNGDGEAIALDNNGNTFALERSARVMAASSHSVRIDAALRDRQWGAPVPADYYVGHWIQVGSGAGIGQARRITGYSRDASGVILQIAPAWDVVPLAGSSTITIGREFWQVYVIGNRIDNRKPLCARSNRSAPRAGGISLWGQAADSIIAGNEQHDSDGIVLQQLYSAARACPECEAQTHMLSNIEVRGNLIDGEYDWADACSSSGIVLSVGASPNPATPPPTVSMGVNIVANRIVHADASSGGAIATTPSWYRGPPPHRWPLIAGLVIQHNSIEQVSGPPARFCGAQPAPKRSGLRIEGANLQQGSVLYDNRCGGSTAVPGSLCSR